MISKRSKNELMPALSNNSGWDKIRIELTPRPLNKIPVYLSA